MVEKRKKGNMVVFVKGDEYIGLILENKGKMYNAVYQKWRGNVKVSNVFAEVDNIEDWTGKDGMTDEEFEELKRIVFDNAVLW